MQPAPPPRGHEAAALDGGAPPLREAPGPREMALIGGLAFFLNLFPGTLLQWAHARIGLALSEILFIAGPAILAVRLFYLDRRTVLPFGRPPIAVVAAAALGAVGLNHLLTLAGTWQESVWPTPPQLRGVFDALFVYHGGLDFAGLLTAFALIPAISEEILFRGFLQAGLTRLLPRPGGALIASALLFALFHLDPWRFLGVAGLGLFLAWIREASGSLLPAMAAHAASNVLSIAMKAAGRLEGDAAPGTPLSAALAAAAVIAAVVTVSLAPRPGERVL